MKTAMSIFYSCVILTLLIAVTGCNTRNDNPREPGTQHPQTQSPLPLQTEVAITAIDEINIEPGKKAKVGHQVMVEGTISAPKALCCVLVHPINGDTWWVQNLPSPPGKIDDKTWRWRTMVYCGTEKLGMNEDYEIVAIAEGERAICQLGKTLKTQDFPSDLPRSEIITVKRVKN